MKQNHLQSSDQDVMARITKKELAKHCRRTTRGTEETTTLIGDLIQVLSTDNARDVTGVPLFNEKMPAIWEQQKKHIACLLDLPDCPLYTKIDTLVKGGVTLPVFRCARGSSSLESFHQHVNTFIPGISFTPLAPHVFKILTTSH